MLVKYSCTDRTLRHSSRRQALSGVEEAEEEHAAYLLIGGWVWVVDSEEVVGQRGEPGQVTVERNGAMFPRR